jgi:CubicO group peptidase (beta-lactamase class C family)
MRALGDVEAGLTAYLDELIDSLGVPGAAVAVRVGHDVADFASGVANLETGVPATPDTLFLIGSVTKVYTATLAMQLVEEGRLVLDAPVKDYLHGFSLADEKAASTVTIRHLITHTNGIEGDDRRDYDIGDDCVARYVDGLGGTGVIHAPGKRWSYSNTGYVVLGRVIEAVTGLPWRIALVERLLEPVGAEMTFPRPNEAILHRVAVGHIRSRMPGQGLRRAPVFIPNYASAPAGSTLAATARDVLRFVDIHLHGGRAADGTPVLSEETVHLMQQPEVELPPVFPFTHGGLGWALADVGGLKVIAHPGGNLGQSSLAVAAPELRIAVVAVGNVSPGGDQIAFAVFTRVLQEVLGVDLSTVASGGPPPPPPEVDLDAYAGRYERLNGRFDLWVEDGRLWARVFSDGLVPERYRAEYGVDRRERVELVPVDRNIFTVRSAEGGERGRLVFDDFDEQGRPGSLHDSRLALRVDEPVSREEILP